MVYIYIYLAIAFITSIYIIKQLQEYPEIQAYIWDYELEPEIKEVILNHPWMIQTSIVIMSLFWPLLLIEYININNNNT